MTGLALRVRCLWRRPGHGYLFVRLAPCLYNLTQERARDIGRMYAMQLK